MVVKAFRNKCYPLGGKGLEWCIYHGLKWCLSLTKVLIIQSEEELPAHYLPENNNVNTRLPGLSQCSLSELVSCSTIHSISTSTVLQDSFPILHYLSLLLASLSLRCLALPPHVVQVPPPQPPLQPNPTRLLPPILQASAAPPLHPTWSWWAIVRFKQMDGEQRGERGAPSACPPCITANQAVGNLLKLSRQSNE